jgi:DNA-binding NtrC family response regulator
MSRLWIVHREPRIRAALARLAVAPQEAMLGAPQDPGFSSAEPPEVVLLGLAAPFEAELEFAHRQAPRLRGSAWLLLAERAELPNAQRLFDALDADLLAYPPDASVLRRRLRELGAGASSPPPLSLSQRAVRDALAARFAAWFGDLELPALLRALDPRLREVPVLVRGEPGTGRGTLARYLHAFGGGGEGVFTQVACAPELSANQLAAALAAAARGARAGGGATLCLLGVDRLAPAVQRELLDWIELGPPAGLLRARTLRWIGTAADQGAGLELDPALRQTLASLLVRIPPLRERGESIPRLVQQIAARICTARGERTRAFSPQALRVLREYPWPGNLRELEAVVAQSLAASPADPIEPWDLEHDGEPFAPLDPEAIGAELIEPEELAAAEPVVEELEIPEPDFVEPEIAEPEATAPKQAPPTPAPPEPPLDWEPEPETLLDAEVLLEEQPEPAAAPPDAGVAPLASALAHELRGPLTGIKTFSQLLPERWTDAEFRARFAERTGEDVRRMEESLELLSRLANLGPPTLQPVDVTGLLSELLEARRESVRERRLLVLQELDAQRPAARGDPEQIRFALDALLSACFGLVPDQGDLYLASKHLPAGLRGGPCLRVLVRFHGPQRGAPAGRVAGVSPAENSLAMVLAERVVRASHGNFTLNVSQGDETLVVLDLPA